MVNFEKTPKKIWMQCPQCEIIREKLTENKRNLMLRGSGNVPSYDNLKLYPENREGYFIELFKDKFEECKILLYGIGWSPLFNKLKKQKLNIIGCDLNKELIDFKNGEYEDEVFFRPNNLPNISFDIITAFEVFEHFLNPFDNLKLLSVHLEKNGVICGCSDFWQRNNTLSNDFYWEGCVSHVTAWNIKAMELAASKLNMKVKYFKSDYGGPNKVYFILYKNDKNNFIQFLPITLSIYNYMLK